MGDVPCTSSPTAGHDHTLPVVEADLRRHAENRFLALYEASPTPALGIDAEGRVTFWNPAAERAFGWSWNEVLGRPDPSVPDTHRDAHRQRIRRIFAGARLRDEETMRTRRDGTPVQTRLTAIPLRDASGRVTEAVVTLRDVTERKRMETELAHLRNDLERRIRDQTQALRHANRELEAFTYSVSHDLRAPLRAIDYFSQALAEDHTEALDAEGRDFLDRIRDGATRMSEHIDGFIELSRASRGELRQEATDLSALARSVVEQLAREDPDRRVEWVIHDGIEGTCDPRLICLVLENLLGNAWKYTSKLPGARIEFNAARRNGGVAYFVRDNGCGFEPAAGHKLFSAFERQHADAEFEGTGIGLATVKRIIERHGGRVWAEGRPGMGATFWFTL